VNIHVLLKKARLYLESYLSCSRIGRQSIVLFRPIRLRDYPETIHQQKALRTIW
jgi:hypothetical protein